MLRQKSELQIFSVEIGRNLSTCCAKYYEDELKLLMTAILYRSNLSSSKYYHLVEKCLNSIPEICDDLRGEYGVMNEMPDLSYEHLMSAHAAGCVGMSFYSSCLLLVLF